ncbi:MAG: hypothetical protein OXC55_06245 [Chloroflexi bacterium]|nr:hypothetical protein [Chloroflexota bacterium]
MTENYANCELAQPKDEVEKPSDYDGVVYIKLDDHGGWREQLIRELENVGLDVGAN